MLVLAKPKTVLEKKKKEEEDELRRRRKRSKTHLCSPQTYLTVHACEIEYIFIVRAYNCACGCIMLQI